MSPFEWLEPTSLAEAVALLDADDSGVRPVSGGTALMLMMKAGVFAPSRLVCLQRLESKHRDIIVPDGALKSEQDIRDYLSGNLCRCAAYPEIIAAVKAAART